jgi:hypothetical protein
MDWTSPENGSDEKYSHDGSSTHEDLEEQTYTNEYHKMPKWDTQILKYLIPNEQNKTGTRSSTKIQEDFALITNYFTDPSTFKEEVKYGEWKKEMIDEYKSMMQNGAWKLVDCPQNVEPIGCKWVYIIKYKSYEMIEKYKSRLVAKGFVQQEGIEYEETFSPTKKWNMIRIGSFFISSKWMEITLDGCQKWLPQWRLVGRSIHDSTSRF